MAPWIWPAVAFAAILCLAALRRRRYRLAAGFVAFALLGVWLSAATAPLARFIAPLVVLVIGYWATAPFYTSPSFRLETWLMRCDDALAVDRLASAAPGWVRALLEIAYVGVTPFMVIAAVVAFTASPDAFGWYWMLVLSAELGCYVTLPWLQARPPRQIRDAIRNPSRLGFPGSSNRGNLTGTGFGTGFLRRLNQGVLDHFSVRATTIPSGHVAGPIAASLSVWMIAPEYGPWLMAGALVITVATVIGRYHYLVDAVLGLAAGALPPAIRSFWL